MSAIKKSVASPEREPLATSPPPVGRGTTTASLSGVAGRATGLGLGDGQAAHRSAATSGKVETRERGWAGRFMAAHVSHRRSRRSMSWAASATAALMFHVSACGRSAEPAHDTPSEVSDHGARAAATPARDELAPDTRPRLGEVRFRDLTPPELRPEVIPPLLDQLVIDALTRDFERAEDDPGACRAAIAIGYALTVNQRPVAEADAGEARALFEGELVCAPPGEAATGDSDGDVYRIELDARRAFGGMAGGASDERLLEALRAVTRDGAAALYGQVLMRHAGDDRIRQALATSDHPGILTEAASEAGERKLVDAVPDLVRLTAHDDPRVATRAGAALGLLKVATPEVLRALVKMTDGAQAEKHLVAIHALADLGTEDARRYLESLSVGHPSPALREIARERLRDPGR